MQKILSQNRVSFYDIKLVISRIHEVKKNIINYCSKYNRDPNQIKLMIVTKGIDYEIIKELDNVEYGFDYFGENYIQESEKKIERLIEEEKFNRDIFHFIGHLQKNKINKVIKYFSSIDSVDSISLLGVISKRSAEQNLTTNVIIEVKTTNEDSKYGMSPDELINKFNLIKDIPNIKIDGLMTMSPFKGSEDLIRRSFRMLKDTWEKIDNKYNVRLPIISMGMSNDYEIAIEEGTTLLRLGRAIFGEVSYEKDS